MTSSQQQRAGGVRVRRLQSLDWLLIVTLLSTWIFCLALNVREGLRSDDARLRVVISSARNPQSYPIVKGVSPYASNRPTKLLVGDHLLSVGGRDLRGVTGLGVRARANEIAGKELLVPFTVERSGEILDIQAEREPRSWWWTIHAFTIALALTAILGLLSSASWHLSRRFFVGSMLLCVALTPCFGGPAIQTYAVGWTIVLVTPLALALAVSHAFEFTDPAPDLHVWQRALPWALAVFLAVLWGWIYFLPIPGPPDLLTPAQFITGVLFIVAILGALTRSYGRSESLGRRKLKWVLYGFYVGLLPSVFALIVTVFFLPESWLIGVARLALVAIPIGILVAIVAYDFLDIDRLISGTASYSLLVILLALGGELLFEPFASRAASSVGLDPGAGQVAFVVLLAAILIPAQRIWRPYVDRIFFAEGRSLATEVGELLEELSGSTETRSVIQRTGAGIERLFHPEFCAIYEQSREVFELKYAVGAGESPPISINNPLIQMLETKESPMRLDLSAAMPSSPELIAGPVSEPAVIIPLRPQGTLRAFVGIGPKRSGDVYTATDLSLLSAVAHAVSTQLEHAISGETARQGE